MTRLALLADLHFGSVPPGLTETLKTALKAAAPDVIVVAGDLTMRSRRREFTDAQAWLKTLAPPLMLLPGNHDLPFWNIFERFSSPFARYAKATGSPLMPVFEDECCFILGLNTTASWQPHWQWQEGTARRSDVLAAEKLLAAVPEDKVRVVATHHPLFTVEGLPRARPVRRFANAIRMLARQNVEMLMHGHLHQQYAMPMRMGAKEFLTIGAPTALSSRVRGEPNGFWVIDITTDCFVLTLHRLELSGDYTSTEPVRIPRGTVGQPVP
jgi:3',5'-cyclic AMP phosphodiesterase CpdA